jgi:DNA-binding IclR family transcriptional regulator
LKSLLAIGQIALGEKLVEDKIRQMETHMNAMPRGFVKSADRVLDILELLASRGRPLSHTEIAVAIGIPKSSLTQLLRNLEARQYLKFIPGPNTFEFGVAVTDLARRAKGMVVIEKLAQSICEKMTREIDESSSLNLLREDYVERVCGSSAPHTLQITMKIGDRAPLYAVSSGKVILAFLPAIERESLLKQIVFEKITARTLATIPDLRKELSKISATGVAFSKGEFTSGIVGVAVPVRNEFGNAIGALNVAIPEVRFNAERELQIVAALKKYAVELEEQLIQATQEQ